MSSKYFSWRAEVNGIRHCIIARTDTNPWFKAFPDGVQAGTGIHWGENRGIFWAHIDVYSGGQKVSQISLEQIQFSTMTVGPYQLTMAGSSPFSHATVVAMQSGISNIGFTYGSGGMTLSAAASGLVGILFYNAPPRAS